LLANSSGAVAVSGTGSQWNNSSYLIVGNGGSGTLNITSGGLVSDAPNCPACSAAVIGYNSGANGIVNVSGAGSIWNNSGPVNVGWLGNGSLNIASGAQVDTSVLIVGSQAGSSGTVAITSGGTLLNNGLAVIGDVAGSTGDVFIDAATWVNLGLVDIGTAGFGSVSIQDGGQLTASGITVGSNGTLVVDPATVDVSGNFTLTPGGLLSLDIAGTAPGSFSQLDIEGYGYFDGTIDFDFIDGFAPQAGQTFDLIDAAAGADLSSAIIQITGLEPGFQYSEAFSNGELTLTALNNGTSDTPEPNSALLFAGALSGLLLAGASGRAFVRWRSSRS